jgi:hypothetical protein
LGHRLVADVFDEPLAVLRAILLRGLLQQHLHFLVGDLDAVGLADFRQQQAKPAAKKAAAKKAEEKPAAKKAPAKKAAAKK